MIYWLLQTSNGAPDEQWVSAPENLLSAEEYQKFAALKTAKRRQDWLLGRWTAKSLLHSVICQHYGVKLPLDKLNILTGPEGAPVVSVEGYPPFSLSISHSNGRSFCALIERGAWPIGADIERMESRSEAFVTDYFTSEEVDQINRSPSHIHDMMVTAIWSAKEASLKALRVGLRADTRAVSCLIRSATNPPLAWQPLGIVLDEERLKGMVIPLVGWWRVESGFVLTLVSQRDEQSKYEDSYPCIERRTRVAC